MRWIIAINGVEHTYSKTATRLLQYPLDDMSRSREFAAADATTQIVQAIRLLAKLRGGTRYMQSAYRIAYLP